MRSPSDQGEVRFFLPIEPVPASRPRVSKWGTYYAGKYKSFLEQAPALVPKFETPLQGPLLAGFVFCATKPRTGKRDWPRFDLDNAIKAASDVLTKCGVWEDDDQVVGLLPTEKRYARPGEEPGIHVHIKKAA